MKGNKSNKDLTPESELRLYKRLLPVIFLMVISLSLDYNSIFNDISTKVSDEYYIVLAQIIPVFFIAVPLSKALNKTKKNSEFSRQIRSLEFKYAAVFSAYAELSCLYAVAFGGTPITLFGSIFGFLALLIFVVSEATS